MSRKTKALLFALLAGLMLMAAAPRAMAVSFTTDWKAALRKPVETNSIAGPWEGQWKSKAHGVSGPLRCVITDLGNGHFQARFHAQFHWFHFTYTAKLIAETTPTGIVLKGQANLGWMGGVYKYAGPVSPTKYFSTYASNVENGVLELSRPQKT